eukprot:TRINITY_DN19402_c0_g1_i3.p1 TRINITY_DN19402_c0_g1~~TRINITY_DN19402_c0_g1_i3.p1  ORF type:complete len:180 (-),score=51.03 TRINITY_DN19402_c0_g1_i3:385-924(-)
MTDAWGGPKEPSGWGDVDKSGDKGGWGSGGDADKADGGKADDGWGNVQGSAEGEGGKGETATGDGGDWGRETERNVASMQNGAGVSVRRFDKEDDGWGKGSGDTTTGPAGGAATEAARNCEGKGGASQAWGQSTGADAATSNAEGRLDSPVVGRGRDDASTDKQQEDPNAFVLAAKSSG